MTEFDLTAAAEAPPRIKQQPRRVPKNDINGWLILDKPIGLTSTEALGAVKRLFRPAKAGHAGTLDPLASGILPLAFGDATKTVPFVVDGRKLYRFTVRWGIATDTDDAEGKAIAESDVRPTAEAVRAVLPDFTGDVLQVPPQYSALKVNGERAYDLAREGETVVLAARPVSIYRLDLVETPDADHAVFEAECGRGAYVRSLARDLGERLGTRGHVTALRRVSVGPFGEAAAHTLDDLEERVADDPEAALAAALRPIESALGDMPRIDVDKRGAVRLRRGQSVILRGAEAPEAGQTAYAMAGSDLVALGEVDAGSLHPTRVFKGRGSR